MQKNSLNKIEIMVVNITFQASICLEGDDLKEIAKKWADVGISSIDCNDVDISGIDYAENVQECEDVTYELIHEINQLSL